VLLNDGYDNGSGGQNYVAREVSPEVGAVSHESVGVTEAGVVFHSAKGKYLLNRALSPTYIGDKVSSYDSETPLAVDVVPSQHQVRFLTSSRMLVLDTVANQWAEWSIADGVHSCVWRDVQVYLSSASGLKEQRTDFTGVDYGMDVETAWIKVNDLQGVGRIRKLLALGEYRSTFKLRLRLARDYATTYFQDKTWTPSPATVGGPLQVKHGPSVQRMQAIKVRFTAVANADGTGVPSGEALKLTGLALELGFKRGLRPNLPAAQRQ
jgi:hypothetical protein